MTATQYLIVRLGPRVLPILERYLSDDRIARSNAGTSYTVKIAPGRELVGIVEDLRAQAGQTGASGREASRAAKRALVRIGQAAQQYPSDASVQRFESLIETWLGQMSPADRQDMLSRRDRSTSSRRRFEKISPTVPKIPPAVLLELDQAASRLASEGRAMMTRFGYSVEEVVQVLQDRLNPPAA